MLSSSTASGPPSPLEKAHIVRAKLFIFFGSTKAPSPYRFVPFLYYIVGTIHESLGILFVRIILFFIGGTKAPPYSIDVKFVQIILSGHFEWNTVKCGIEKSPCSAFSN